MAKYQPRVIIDLGEGGRSSSSLLPVSSRAGLVARDLRVLDEMLDIKVGQITEAFQQLMERQTNQWYKDSVLPSLAMDLLQDGRLSGSLRNQARAKRFAGAWTPGMLDAREQMLIAFRRAPNQIIDLATESLRRMGRKAIIPGRVLDGFYQLKRDEFSGTLERMLNESATIARKAVMSQQSLGELMVEIREVVDPVPGRLARALDTALMELVQLIVLSGSRSDDVFMYSGPIDHRIRTFCLRHVGRVYDRPSIDKLNNGQLPNTFLTRGGYNCRHVWRPVVDPSLVALAGTGQVVRSSWAQEIRSVAKLQRSGKS